MTERFVHYSHAPVTELLPIEFDPLDTLHGDKPPGFWFSVDGVGHGWRDYVIQIPRFWPSLTHVHDLTLATDANILRLTDAAAIDSFTREFRDMDHPLLRFTSISPIAWLRVMERWQGIIVAPYVWERRRTLETFWYNTWDCASGCIWDVTAVAEIRLREIVPMPEPEPDDDE